MPSPSPSWLCLCHGDMGGVPQTCRMKACKVNLLLGSRCDAELLGTKMVNKLSQSVNETSQAMQQPHCLIGLFSSDLFLHVRVSSGRENLG